MRRVLPVIFVGLSLVGYAVAHAQGNASGKIEMLSHASPVLVEAIAQ